MTDQDYQEKFLKLIDKIIEKILKVSTEPTCRISTVTNGIYEPDFLFKVMDKIDAAVGIRKVDINFSYDLKYRYTDEATRLKVLDNISKFHKRYNYKLGVQMILTQYLIDMVKNGAFDVNEFEQKEIPGNLLALLYPHKPRAGVKLPDFYFSRKDFLWFYGVYLKQANLRLFNAFGDSCKNSQDFKWTGMFFKKGTGLTSQPAILSDGKELRHPECKHSVLYRYYTDSERCMLCDIEALR